MTGLQRILKEQGRITLKTRDKTVLWVWDYFNDQPRIEAEMTREEMAASVRAKLGLPAKEINY